MLEISRVGKRFPNGYAAIEEVSLTLGAGEILAIVGASGCGKSTLLRLVAGLEAPTSGEILINGRRLTGPVPEIGVVFQEPRLMPWLSVRDNTVFGLADLPRAERQARADAVLAKVGLTRFADALPKSLSGGMAQRTALARALAGEPEVLLLDEPFSALDAMTRQALQEHLLQIWAQDLRTMLLVTHDLDEAVAMADRVVVLGGYPGRVQLELDVRLPRPRVRTAAAFQALKERLLAELPPVFPAAA
ncbi:MAG: ABC transporter ATP-binding protein [Geminicoccaceae bacterium]